MASSLGDRKKALTSMGVEAQNKGQLALRVAKNLAEITGILNSAQGNTSKAYDGLQSVGDTLSGAETKVQAGYKGVHQHAGSVAKRVEGSVRDPLLQAGKTLGIEDHNTNRERKEVHHEAGVAANAFEVVAKVRDAITGLMKLATQAQADAERGGGNMVEAGKATVTAAGAL